jgi:predicted amidophosphoribosyltransferase
VTGPPSIIETVSLGPYEGPLGILVREAKYGPNLALIDQLGARLGVALRGHFDVDAIVPVPIPRGRLLRRGFDQGERIGRGVSAATGIPYTPLLKRQAGETQVGKTAAQRRELPIRAISVSDGPLPARVLLVDDVRTTGSTLHAAARALRRRGVPHIWAATLSYQGG